MLLSSKTSVWCFCPGKLENARFSLEKFKFLLVAAQVDSLCLTHTKIPDSKRENRCSTQNHIVQRVEAPWATLSVRNILYQHREQFTVTLSDTSHRPALQTGLKFFSAHIVTDQHGSCFTGHMWEDSHGTSYCTYMTSYHPYDNSISWAMSSFYSWENLRLRIRIYTKR